MKYPHNLTVKLIKLGFCPFHVSEENPLHMETDSSAKGVGRCRTPKYRLAGCAETEARVRALEREILYAEGRAKIREEEDRIISMGDRHISKKTAELAERAEKRRALAQEKRTENEANQMKPTKKGKMPSYMSQISTFMRENRVSTRL